MDETTDIFLTNLKAVMKHRKISQIGLSKMTGISHNTVNNYMLKRSGPSLALAFKICDVLNLNIDEMCENKTIKSTMLQKLEDLFYNLNIEGKEQLIDYAESLTYNPKYKNIKKEDGEDMKQKESQEIA